MSSRSDPRAWPSRFQGERPALPRDTGYLLHALRAELAHPTSGERLTICAAPPEELCAVDEAPFDESEGEHVNAAAIVHTNAESTAMGGDIEGAVQLAPSPDGGEAQQEQHVEEQHVEVDSGDQHQEAPAPKKRKPD